MRLALGASRKDILRHLLAESCVLATLGTGAGLLISLWFTAALPALPLPISFPIDLHVSADWRLIVYATALAFASTIACGLTPAWKPCSSRRRQGSEIDRDRRAGAVWLYATPWLWGRWRYRLRCW